MCPHVLQDLAAQLQSDCRRGLSANDEDDRSARTDAFGANRLQERKEVSFGELVLEALEVSPGMCQFCSVA